MLRAAFAVGSLRIAMAMQGPARGVVVDASGRPLAGAVVWSWWEDHAVTTGDDGAFVVPSKGRFRGGESHRGLGGLYIPTPAGVHVTGAGHEDYVSETWFWHDAELSHAQGPTLTEGLPLDAVLSDLTDVDNRDVRVVLDADDQVGFPVSDVRGRLANGRRYRYVGIFGECSNTTASPRKTPWSSIACSTR